MQLHLSSDGFSNFVKCYRIGEHELEEDDVIAMGSGGLFDNLCRAVPWNQVKDADIRSHLTKLLNKATKAEGEPEIQAQGDLHGDNGRVRIFSNGLVKEASLKMVIRPRESMMT